MSSEELRAVELLDRVPYGHLATSIRAMPFLVPARHIVADGGVLLRLHAVFDYERACCGSVVAYAADNLDSGSAALWSVQFTGTAEAVRPTGGELERFGPRPHRIDGEEFRPAYLRLEPRFATVHTMDRFDEPSAPRAV
ncbi:pyridoxamine 5'-phosphate oxidase family protein [Streptomyces sp. NPDC003023]|uniref:pyridoxamine 5'-phosphate oxidase family protein n=1 Tax=Streptomyces sp. NPDC003023 TaxID=3364675 RepID=UPI0036830345